MALWNDFVRFVGYASDLVASVKGGGGGGGIVPRPLPGPGSVVNLNPYGVQPIAGPYDVQTPIPDSPYIPDALERYVYGNGNTGAVVPANGGGSVEACNFGNVVRPPRYEQRIKCDPGWVAVRCRDANGLMAEMCMFKPVARALKLWKPRAKAAVSAKDMKVLNTASRTAKKLERIAKKAGALPKPRRRRAS